jgi:starch-binding outer membrane protein, SusD/RagB family
MNKLGRYFAVLIPFMATVLLLSSCESFLNPDQELQITEDKLFDDWYEYRSVEMGLYALQQDLVEQLVVLGELRGDMLTITPNAEADLVEIYNFNFSKDNKYASPTKFFKLISACNNFIRILEREHPEVMNPESPINNYDRLYGEALCMRAWTYFYAVRIYGKVPYIEESLVTMEEIQEFVNSSGTYTDSVYIEYAINGYYNDTLYNKPITFDKRLYDMDMVIDVFTNQLENDVKAVGVNHYINNNNTDWEIVIWNTWAWHALLGQMYLYQGDLAKAAFHYEKIIYGSTEENRYQCTQATGGSNWASNFSTINNMEHILVIWFNKENFQKNDLQKLFSPFDPHQYMLKPTKSAVMMWETEWSNYSIDESHGPDKAKIRNRGIPNDDRGAAVSYSYTKGRADMESALKHGEVTQMLQYKAEGDLRTVNTLMEGYDTVVWKYSINKQRWDEDANFYVYRAGGIHLNLAEVYTYWAYDQGGFVTSNTNNALNILNTGRNYSELNSRPQRGVRGRVGAQAIDLYNIIYIHDPTTNEVIGYYDYTGKLAAKQRYLDAKILEERGREQAFEGERFYDLMRIAKRRNDPSFLAEKVAQKYPPGKREQIYNYLLDENNWYINFFN